MSKSLIDLTRANAPRSAIADELQTPVEQPKPEKPPRKKGDAVEKKTPSNANLPQSIPLATVSTIPDVQERYSTLGARIPDSLHQAIRVHCTTHRVEIQKFVQEALANHLALQNQQERP